MYKTWFELKFRCENAEKKDICTERHRKTVVKRSISSSIRVHDTFMNKKNKEICSLYTIVNLLRRWKSSYSHSLASHFVRRTARSTNTGTLYLNMLVPSTLVVFFKTSSDFNFCGCHHRICLFFLLLLS